MKPIKLIFPFDFFSSCWGWLEYLPKKNTHTILFFILIYLQICIFGTIANILNIIVLTRKDMSKTPINTILKWLAVADMFLMIEYIPFSIYMYIFPGT